MVNSSKVLENAYVDLYCVSGTSEAYLDKNLANKASLRVSEEFYDKHPSLISDGFGNPNYSPVGMIMERKEKLSQLEESADNEMFFIKDGNKIFVKDA